MKPKSLTLIFASLLLLTACSNNKETADKKETSSDKVVDTKGTGKNIITFKVNGEAVTSSGWNLSRFDMNNGAGTSLNVTSNMHEQPKTINININGDKPGTYSLKLGTGTTRTPGIAYGSYKPDYMNDMMNSFSFIDGDFTIVSIDTTAGLLNATFHGTVKNMKDEKVTITDGKVINGDLKPGITKLN